MMKHLIKRINCKFPVLKLVLLGVCIFGRPSRAQTSIYIFDHDQSTVVQTGGFAGVNWTYAVEGRFQLTIDFDAGTASFDKVDANAVDDSQYKRTLDPNDVFAMTSLVGIVTGEETLEFTGYSADGSSILLEMTIADDVATMKAQTTPPPNSADFFIFSMGAVANRKYAGGTGEPNNPYQIATAGDLIALGNEPNDYNKHFILIADIDLGGYVFDRAVIAPDVNSVGWQFDGIPFNGVLDGNKYVISNLTITEGSYLGLFGQLDLDANIFNFGLEGVDVEGRTRIASLAGRNYGCISGVFCTGTVSGSDRVGGLVGVNGPDGQIVTSYSTISTSANSGSGGLVGRNYGSITRSYSVGMVSGEILVGGLVGNGRENSIVTSSFWDIETSGQSTSMGGTGKTTAEMMDPNTFISSGWDFVDETANGTEDIWKIVEGQTYPLLSWQKYGGGTGEPDDPYLIYTAEHLNALGAEPNDWDKHFQLMADIDLDPNLPGRKVFDRAVIAPDTDPCDLSFVGLSFMGVFDGNGRTVSNMKIKGANYLGLFGRVESAAQIKNLGVVDFNIAGSDYLGGLVGFSRGSIAMSYCTGSISGDRFLGGLTGRNWLNITECHSKAIVTGSDDVGGIAGGNYGSITNSYSTGGVTANWDAGGLVGANSGNISTSYSTTIVIGENRAGGLVGYNWSDDSVTLSFWDIQASGQAESAGGTGKTTAEMQTENTFTDAGWDFAGEAINGTDDIWWIEEGQDYPRLWWELTQDDN